MDERETIDEYDLVEIIHVPENLKGVMDIGDIGVVIEKYDRENFKIECIQPGGSCNWLAQLHINYIRLKSRDPYGRWVKKTLTDEPILRTSALLGSLIGGIFGGLTGVGLGAITRSLNGILIGLAIGLILGSVTGALTAALTVKTAGRTGGVGVGYYTGMVFGGVFGLILGGLIPTSLRTSAHTEGLPVLDALMSGRLETAFLSGFLFSVLATIVGVWIGGKNLVPRNLKERYRP
jgi:MFS family permease